MSERNTRNRTKSTPDCFKTSSEIVAKYKSPFDCFICGRGKHLTTDCTYRNEEAVEGAMALVNKALLVCNACVDDKQPNKFIKESETRSEQNQLQKLRKKWLSWGTLSLKPERSWPKTNSQTRQTPRTVTVQQRPPYQEKLDGSRSIGIPETKNNDAHCWQEHASNEVQNLLGRITIDAAIGDVTTLVKHDTKELGQFSLKCAAHNKDAWFSSRSENCNHLGGPSSWAANCIKERLIKVLRLT